MERKNNQISVLIVVVTYLVGIVGFRIPQTKPLFLWMVPFHLLLVFGLQMWQHPKWNRGFGIFLALGYLVSFFAEYVGVHTGLLFGNYQYGPVLGLKLNAVPLMIGINWLLLAYSTFSVASYALKNNWTIVIVSSLLMVAMDFLIEPVAINLNFWSWQDNVIPLFNYVCWFWVAMVVNLVAIRTQIGTNVLLGSVVLLSQAVFFLFLH